MKIISIVFLTFFGFIGITYSLNSDFQVKPLNLEDKKFISSILQKQESKWVPAEELKKYPGLYWQEDLQGQSFRMTSSQNGLEDAYFVPIQANYSDGLKSMKSWSQSLSLLLIIKKNSSIVKLPEHPVTEWSFDHIEGVAFRDLEGKGRRSIIVNAAGITGIGPTGTVPFNVIAVYLQSTDGTWKLDSELQEKIDDQMYTKCKLEKCRDLKTIIKFAENYFKKK